MLDELVSEGKIKAKEFGKTVIYLINQDYFPELPQEEFAKMNNEISEMKDILRELTEKHRENMRKIKLLQMEMTNEDLEKNLENASKENQEMNIILEEYGKNKDKLLKEEEIKVHENSMIKMENEYKKRLKWSKDLFSTIAENSEKSKQQLIEEMGLEF